MTTTRIKGGSSMSMKGNMHAGLSRKSPPGVDKSMRMKGPSVNSDATRGGTAPTPRTLGPRNA